MATEQSIYTTGGTVQAGGGIYLSRKADDELLQLCREGQFAYVLTPRQMGKSSLMVQTAQRLEEEGITSVIIDLTKIGTEVSAEQWYLGLLTEIDETLMFDTDIFEWWENNNRLGVTQRLTNFFEEVLLDEVNGQIAVFVDEIDTTLSLGFTDDFFIAIRYFYTARAQKEDFGRLSFVLIGVASPGNLIRDPQRTPFNVGKGVELKDFSFDEAQPLIKGLDTYSVDDEAQSKKVLKCVLKWTGGHPYLTQRLFNAIVEERRNEWNEDDIQRVVEKLFFVAAGQTDNNLLFVRDMLTKRTPNGNSIICDVLKTYRDVCCSHKKVVDEEKSIVKSHLKLSGVVRRDSRRGSLYVSNAIYKNVFNREWVEEHLSANESRKAKKGKTALILSLAITVPFSIYALGQQRIAQRQLILADLDIAALQAKSAIVPVINGCVGEYRYTPTETGNLSIPITKSVSHGRVYSGFIVTSDGYIATTASAIGDVVDGYKECKEKLFEEFVYFLEEMSEVPEGNFLKDPRLVDLIRNQSMLYSFEEISSVIHPSGDNLAFSLKTVSPSKSQYAAIIKIEVKNAPSLHLLDIEFPNIRDEVFVIGYPFSQKLPSSSFGEPTVLETSVANPFKTRGDGSSVIQLSELDHSQLSRFAGSPVINRDGIVIGQFSQGGFDSSDAMLPHANPTGEIEELLRQSGASINEGPTTKLYREGLEDFQQGRYVEAKLKFEAVISLSGSNLQIENLIRRSNAEIADNQLTKVLFPYIFALALLICGIASTSFLFRRRYS